jgi:PAS domain S-box-containing protein
LFDLKHRVAEADPVMTWSSQPDKFCNYLNDRWLDFTGRDLGEEVGEGWAKGVHPEDVDQTLSRYWRAFDKREPVALLYRLKRRDGEYRWILDQAEPWWQPDGEFIGYNGACTDVTLVKRMHEDEQGDQLRRRRLETIGAMASGVVHDLSNMMTCMMGYSDLIRRGIDQGSPIAKHVERLFDEVQRAAELSRGLLIQPHKAVTLPATVDVNEVVTDLVAHLKLGVPTNITLVTELGMGLPRVAGDGASVRRIVMNLVMNGVEAIRHAGGHGLITISSGWSHVDDRVLATCVGKPKLRPSRVVWLKVTDSGQGISPEVVGKIFRPDFTTRGDGHGFGLAAVLAIVESLGGAVLVDAGGLGNEGSQTGASFRVMLPVVGEG